MEKELSISKKRIPFHEPWFDNEEITLAIEAIKSGKISGGGPFSKKIESRLKKLFNVDCLFLTPSATHAIELALMAIGLDYNKD